MSLQEDFIESRGAPVIIDGVEIHQAIKIPLTQGTFKIEFVSEPNEKYGIRVCAKLKIEGKWWRGKIWLDDGNTTPKYVIWDEPGLPRTVSRKVYSPSGIVLVYNAYREYHPKMDLTTEDSCTGDAGMVIFEQSDKKMRIGCNDWHQPFDPHKLVFDLEWEEDE